MLKPRTALFILAGVFLFLAASLDRAQRASDCNAIADALTEQLRAVDNELAGYAINDARRNRQGLVEAAASLARLQRDLDQLALSTDTMKKSRDHISNEVDNLQRELSAMANQNVAPPLVVTARDVNETPVLGASVEKILAEYEATRTHLGELVGQAERSCTE